MDIIITEWGLDAYLNLKHAQVFTRQEYKTQIRPDVLLLRDFPNRPEFSNSKFWGPATDKAGNSIQGAFKMKWHNIGNGKVQLREGVAIGVAAFLCQAWVKSNDAKDKREAAKLKSHLNAIAAGNYTERGRL